MRQIVLDTETTGLEPNDGHRVIEIGCLELLNRQVTERTFHHYINPEREIDQGALEVHGLTLEVLAQKPLFSQIAADFVEYIQGAELIIHNAPFDIAFLDAELEKLGDGWGTTLDYCTVLDTLPLARDLHPGQRNNLDALCRRYNVVNEHRELHGALLDAELLAEVYLAMTGGQVNLVFSKETEESTVEMIPAKPQIAGRAQGKCVLPSEAERSAHKQNIEGIGKEFGELSLWGID